ncbi:hypothetical protein [Streptomyces sp. NPDC048665]|uniref:hypothetical protein n=1 Tax=Streptomyces sp. NPDC048665 TaxID=3155490 RepID=UPI00342BDF64
MTATNMVNACRLAWDGTGPDDQKALITALVPAEQFHRSTTEYLKRARHQFPGKPRRP